MYIVKYDISSNLGKVKFKINTVKKLKGNWTWAVYSVKKLKS